MTEGARVCRGRCGREKPAACFRRRTDSNCYLFECRDCEAERCRERREKWKASTGRPPPRRIDGSRTPIRPLAAIPRTPIGDDEITAPIDVPEAPAPAPATTRPEKPAKTPVPEQPLRTEEPARAERYIITYAQNATPVHAGFLAALRVYCAENDARLIVLPGKYKNPTSIITEQMEHDEWWAPELHPWLFAGAMMIGANLRVRGDISIQPTAVTPLSGMHDGHTSVIFGHPKVQLSTVAGLPGQFPRILTTTGAVTTPNYTPTKAGKKAQEQHVIGACVVERDPHLFHLRQITAMPDGSFIDLDREYTAEGARPAPRATALVLGDVLVEVTDWVVIDATLRRPDSIAAVLRPEHVVLHDTLDFATRNHHTRDSFTDRYARATGRANDSVEAEVMRAIEFVDSIEDALPVVVRSNHDDAFDRWLASVDYRADPRNARFYVDTMAAVLDEYERDGEWPDAFALLYRQRGQGRARFLALDESFAPHGVELGQHGHNGADGARGTLRGYARLGIPTITGHGHSPGIEGQAYRSGVCQRRMGYARGPSSWLTTHAVLYSNGARSLISVIRGQWRCAPARRAAKVSDTRPGAARTHEGESIR